MALSVLWWLWQHYLGIKPKNNINKCVESHEKSNTTISIVGMNVTLSSQEDLRRIAEIATHGQIRAINPVNTSLDGDTVFVFSTEELTPHLSHIGTKIEDGDWYKLYVDVIAQAAAKVVQKSIYDACYSAESIQYTYAYEGKIPSAKADS